MGALPTGAVTPRRTRARAYLLLARVSNLPTVWSNVAAGLTAAAAPLDGFWLCAAALSCFYAGGMFLNDAFDVAYDVTARPDRPIPAGDTTRMEAFVAGGVLLAIGEALLLASPRPAAALAWGAALAAAIVFYNYRHRGETFGPLVMGLCRALVYVVAAAAFAALTATVAAAASVMWVYVIALTWVAKLAGRRAGQLVPWMLAGISLIDAAVVVATGGTWLIALLCVAGFLLTRALQRVVPGT